MLSRYDAQEAERYLARYGADYGPELAERVYTSHLLGADADLVLHGGGNTSVKATAREIDGTAVDVLYVKGSGWDLSDIEPRGFPACRLAPLLAYCALDTLTDEEMVRGLRSQMLDPASPTPSVEALLHALMPARFVDHTHSTAVLTVVNQPDGKTRAQEVWGDDLLFVSYVMPGFALARQIYGLKSELARAKVMVLDKHGVFTWGETGRQSYEAMIDAVTAAEVYVQRERPAISIPRRAPLMEADRRQWQRRLAPMVRGEIAKRDGVPPITRWFDNDAVLSLLARSDAPNVTQIGPVTPDHVIRTKPFPLWLELPPSSTESETGLRAHVAGRLQAYAERYGAYFEENRQRQGRELRQLPSTPKLVSVPGIGTLALGATISDVKIAGDIHEQTARVIENCLALGAYQPVSHADLFDVEYWSLEQAKLKRAAGSPRALARRIALVTGAAGGIGLATARQFLLEGACVTLADVDGQTLAAAVEELAGHGAWVNPVRADVRDPEQAHRLVAATVDAFGGLDIVVSNAGDAPSGALHTAPGDDALRRSLELNLLAHQNVAKAATEVMLTQDVGGCLLFNASKSAFNQGPLFGPYAVAKTALVALMRQYAVDLGQHGIRANAINADRIRTRIFTENLLEQRAKARGTTVDEYFQSNLLHRETTAHDVAAAFLYLATADATTGCVVTVDGGNAAAFPR